MSVKTGSYLTGASSHHQCIPSKQLYSQKQPQYQKHPVTISVSHRKDSIVKNNQMQLLYTKLTHTNNTNTHTHARTHTRARAHARTHTYYK